MAEFQNNNNYTVSPSWKYYFFSYLISFLTIPLLGAGLIGLYFVRKIHKNTSYIITNNRITAKDINYEQSIDLINIEKITLKQHWVHKQFGIGSLIIQSTSSAMKLLGLEQPQKVKIILEKAILTLKKSTQKKKPKIQQGASKKPMNNERIDYLTGLWQQGLISEKDYKKERRHFENK